MKVTKMFRLSLGALAIVCLLGIQSSKAGTVALVNTFLGATDYSSNPGGLDLGKEGFIFFNWGNSSTANASAYQNLNNQLPAWMTFVQTQGDADSGVSDNAYSNGGLVSLTPPVGPAAASGSLNDPDGNGNSSNTIRRFTMLPGHPASYLLSVVVDNANQLHNPDDRLRARLDLGGGVNAAIGDTGFDGSPDVYQFQMDTAGINDFLKIQLRSFALGGGGTSAGLGNDPGIAGFMIDLIPVPEPSSAALLVLGALGLVRRRRRS